MATIIWIRFCCDSEHSVSLSLWLQSHGYFKDTGGRGNEQNMQADYVSLQPIKGV